MDRTLPIVALVAAALALGSLGAAASDQGKGEDTLADPAEASIPFADHGGIYDWRADRDMGLWVQDNRRNWYYAKLFGPCIGLDFANSIGFLTRPPGQFDRFSKIVVPRQGTCAIASFVRSDAPPPKAARKKKAEMTDPGKTGTQ
jgi:hypothetical protein